MLRLLRHRRVALTPQGGGGSSLLRDLAAYWRLDESRLDRLDEVTGLLLSPGSIPTSAPGASGAALSTASTQYLSINDNAVLSMADNDFTLACWVKFDSIGASASFVTKWTSTGNVREYALWYTGNRFYFSVSRLGTSTTSTNVVANTFGAASTGVWYHLCAWHDAAADKIYISVNNGAADEAAHSGGVFDGASPFQVGRLASSTVIYHAGQIDEIGVWRRVLTVDERDALYNGGTAQTWPFAAITNNIVVDGDSLTAGSGSTSSLSYPQQLCTLLGRSRTTVANLAVPSQTLADMNTDAATQIDALLVGGAQNTILVWGGVNDCVQSADAATIQSRLSTYWAARRASGWRVIAATITPASSLSGAQNTVREAVNTWIRAQGASYDALVDLDGDSRLSSGGAIPGAVDSGDGVHYNNIGYSYVAELFATAI